MADNNFVLQSPQDSSSDDSDEKGEEILRTARIPDMDKDLEDFDILQELMEKEGETLDEFLQRFSDAALKRITSDPTLNERFASALLQGFGDLERREDGLENLLSIIQRLNNFESLERSFESLLPVRLQLLESLDKGKARIERLYRACSLGRFLGSSLDLGSTAVGLWLRESQSARAGLAFDLARNFGLLAFACATSEQAFTNQIFNGLIAELKSDQSLSAPIQKWYQQCGELEEAMTAVFPFQITNDLVNDFRHSAGGGGAQQLNSVHLLSSLIRAVGEQDVNHLRNERLIRTLVNFTLMPASQDWCEWILFYRHPIMLDVQSVIIQLQSKGFADVMNQALPVLRAGEQSLLSFTMWVRMALNCAVIYESLRSPAQPEVAQAIQQLREHLATETAALRRIVEFVRSRRKGKN